MYLGLINASIRKLLRVLLQTAVLYLNVAQIHTYKGHLKHILEQLEKLFQSSDKCFTSLYECMKTNGRTLPMRFNIPKTESLLSSLNAKNSFDFFLDCIEFTKQSNRYLSLHDESIRLSVKYQEVFQKLQYTMVKYSDEFLLGHALHLLSKKCRKEWLRDILKDENDMILDMFYMPTARTSSDIYTRSRNLHT